MKIEKITYLGITGVEVSSSIQLKTSSGSNLTDSVSYNLFYFFSSKHYILHLLLFPLFIVVDYLLIDFKKSQFQGLLKSCKKEWIQFTLSIKSCFSISILGQLGYLNVSRMELNPKTFKERISLRLGKSMHNSFSVQR